MDWSINRDIHMEAEWKSICKPTSFIIIHILVVMLLMLSTLLLYSSVILNKIIKLPKWASNDLHIAMSGGHSF